MDSQQWMACSILLLVIIGSFGNALSFLLFSRPHMKCSSVNVLLCALSFIDFSLLLLSIPTFVIPNLDLWLSAVTFLAYVLKLIYPLNLIMQTCSVYTMLVITFERWTAVCRPLQVRVWCTPKKSRLAVLCIFVFAVLYNFARFFEYRLIHTTDGAIYERWLRDPTNYR
uniref:G_PROTEIN_RECEP_F1_2 domain-containing protein n=1 Tax=Angiostrongylus cantonensis TaxID=6313 RepID=A0A0K0CX04_ANGCA